MLINKVDYNLRCLVFNRTIYIIIISLTYDINLGPI